MCARNAKISDRNNSIQQLEAEIKQYQTDIDALSQEANSLQKTLKDLGYYAGEINGKYDDLTIEVTKI